jgi:hypothetical protein
MTTSLPERMAIREVVENWAIWRDTGQFDKLATTFHDEGVFRATWFNGPFAEFVAASRLAWQRGARAMHVLGGSSIEQSGHRAIAHTKMEIIVRGHIDDVAVDVNCWGRFFDFFELRAGRWAIVRRACIYDKSCIAPVMPGTPIVFDQTLLESLPEAYRYLAYLQVKIGQTVDRAMLTTRDPGVDALYAEGVAWVAGGRSA